MAFTTQHTSEDRRTGVPPQETRASQAPRHEDQGTAQKAVLGTGSAAEAAAGIGAAVLAILALNGALEMTLASIALIAAGGGFVLRGAALSARAAQMTDRADRTATAGLAGGMGAEVIGGLGAVALGILALLGVQENTLLYSGLVVLGGTLLLGGSATPVTDGSGHGMPEAVPMTAAGGDALLGIGALTLGILALIGVGAPLVLAETGLIVVGAGLVLEASPLLGRLVAGR